MLFFFCILSTDCESNNQTKKQNYAIHLYYSICNCCSIRYYNRLSDFAKSTNTKTARLPAWFTRGNSPGNCCHLRYSKPGSKSNAKSRSAYSSSFRRLCAFCARYDKKTGTNGVSCSSCLSSCCRCIRPASFCNAIGFRA